MYIQDEACSLSIISCIFLMHFKWKEMTFRAATQKKCNIILGTSKTESLSNFTRDSFTKETCEHTIHGTFFDLTIKLKREKSRHSCAATAQNPRPKISQHLLARSQGVDLCDRLFHRSVSDSCDRNNFKCINLWTNWQMYSCQRQFKLAGLLWEILNR